MGAGHSILGTLQYMAPEQWEGKKSDARTDIFAFGTVLYEMATGKKAFKGQSQASLISAIMSSEPPPPPSTVESMTPVGVDYVVRTCLSKDPDDRWQSARDLLRELKRVESGGAVSTESATATPKPAFWQRPAFIAAAVLVALVAGGLAVWTLTRPVSAPAYHSVAKLKPRPLVPDGSNSRILAYRATVCSYVASNATGVFSLRRQRWMMRRSGRPSVPACIAVADRRRL